MKRLWLLAICLLIACPSVGAATSAAFLGGGTSGVATMTYLLRCFSGTTADQDFSDAQVIDTAAEGCTEGSLTIYNKAGTSSSVGNLYTTTGSTASWGHNYPIATAFTRNIGSSFFVTASRVSGGASPILGLYSVSSVSDLVFNAFAPGFTGQVDFPPSIGGASDPTIGVSLDHPHKFAIVVGGFSSSGVPYKSGDTKADYKYGSTFFGKVGTSWYIQWKNSTYIFDPVYPIMSGYAGADASYAHSNILVPDYDFSAVLQPTFLDTFTGTDATSLVDHTPDVGGAWTVGAGTWTIQGNKASSTTASRVLAYASSPTNVMAQMILTINSGVSGSGGGVCANASDSANYWIADLIYSSGGADTIGLFSVEADATTVRASTEISPITTASYPIMYKFDGTNRTIYYSTYSAASSYSFNNTVQTIGMVSETGGGWTAVTFDHFAVWPLTSTTYDTEFAKVGY